MKQFYMLLLIAGLFLSISGTAGQPQKGKQTPQSPLGSLGLPHYSLLNINNITTWMRRDGQSNHAPTGAEGVYYPRGTRWMVYQDGFVWGGKVYLDSNYSIPHPDATQLVRVGGATYNVGTRAGHVIGFGSTAVPADPNLPEVRIFRVRRDYAQMSQDELRRDASEYFEIPLADVTQTQINDIYNQYHTDWNEWPVQRGAPYIERNGTPGFQQPPPFGPTFTVDSLISGNYDEPGLAGTAASFPADQVIWTVYNDLDRFVSTSLYGSEPLGLEVQVTIWGYKRTDALGQSYFKRIRLINKGGVDRGGSVMGSLYIDSMYVSQWSDPDVGAFGDDLVGCDTVLKMGFAYNGNPVDAEFAQLNLPPPAFGYTVAQGPIVPGLPSDTGIFAFRRVQGKKNLTMSSFGYFSPGASFSDPPFTREGGLRWWKMLRGFVPDPSSSPDRQYPHPPGEPTSFYPLNGDPIRGELFIDGRGTSWSFIASDRRLFGNTGPFRLAPGDTQEVIITNTGGIGSDRLSSLAIMKTHARVARSALQNLLGSKPPLATSVVTYPNPADATVRLHADARGTNAQAITATLLTPAGNSVGSFSLYDDGTHGDTLAGDGRWTNELTIARRPQGLSARLTIHETGGSMIWDGIVTNITTIGPLSIRSLAVFADNGNNDGRANPGEIVRYGFSTSNAAAAGLSQLRVAPESEFDGKTRSIVTLSVGATDSMIYNPAQPISYFSVRIPNDFADSNWTIHVSVSDTAYNLWTGSLDLRVHPLGFQIPRAVVNHVAGPATGDPDVVIVDPASIQNHLYVIYGKDSVAGGEPGFTLKDSTTGTVLLENHPLPDTLGFNVPVTAGFRLRLGTLPTVFGMNDWEIPSGERRFTWADADMGFEGFSGAIGWNEPAYYFGMVPDRTVPGRSLKHVLIKLATASSGTGGNPNAGNNPYGGWNENDPGPDQNFSYAYRYLRAATAPPARPEFAPYIINTLSGYAYQDYKRGVPFSAWNIETNPPTRLAVAFLENNVAGGLVDGKWWPPANATGITSLSTREWAFILDAPYTGNTPNPAFIGLDILSQRLPVIWWLGVNRRANNNFFTGDEFLIRARKSVSSLDVWTFNPTIVLGIEGDNYPAEFSLYQNYPNPFNPSTTIKYQLAMPSLVTIKIYNILGQEITTLVDEVREQGTHTAIWHGTNRAGNRVATGVYFYRLEAKPSGGNAGTFTRVNKMVLLK